MGELGYIVRRQSPEPHYQQTLRVCGGLQCFKYGCYCKEAPNSEAGILHTHVEAGSTHNLQNQHILKVTMTLTTKMESVHYRVQVNVCATSNEIP